MPYPAFAPGTNAWFICDTCGFRYPYLSQILERDTNARVCWQCVDDPLPQRFAKPRVDPEALANPRPDYGGDD